jgi:hypothetical protein
VTGVDDRETAVGQALVEDLALASGTTRSLRPLMMVTCCESLAGRTVDAVPAGDRGLESDAAVAARRPILDRQAQMKMPGPRSGMAPS